MANPELGLTLADWLGGASGLHALTTAFYARVRADPLLAPVFAHMDDQHPAWVAQWLTEVFGGPATYTAERGGYPHMIEEHRGRALTEEQRAQWVRLMLVAADEAGMPADPETRSAFVGYIEWGSRIALANSQPGASPPEHLPVPRWSWGQGGLPGSALGGQVREEVQARTVPVEPQTPHETSSGVGVGLPGAEPPGFARDIAPLFTERDRASMSWAFDLHDYADVRTHAAAILAQVESGRMPCYGAWTGDQVTLLRRWIEMGTAP